MPDWNADSSLKENSQLIPLNLSLPVRIQQFCQQIKNKTK